MKKLRLIAMIATLSSLFSVASVHAQVPSAAVFGARVKASLATQPKEQQVIPAGQRVQPAMGASEPLDVSGTPALAVTPSSEPYNAGQDLTSGIVAAGAALMGAVLIILILIMVATSRHHERE